MAKGSSGEKPGDQNRSSEADDNGDRIPQQLRDFAQKATELAQNPVARTMIAAGLVTAAAALTANKKVRDSALKAGRDATDGAEEAARAAGEIGTAVVNAATEAFRKFANVGGGTQPEASGAEADSASPETPAPARETQKASSGKKGAGGAAKPKAQKNGAARKKGASSRPSPKTGSS
jgi:hypothetical protein